MRARTSSQSICSRSARAYSSTCVKSGSCSRQREELRRHHVLEREDVDAQGQTSSTGARSIVSSVIGPLAGLEDQVDERAVLVPRLVAASPPAGARSSSPPPRTRRAPRRRRPAGSGSRRRARSSGRRAPRRRDRRRARTGSRRRCRTPAPRPSSRRSAPRRSARASRGRFRFVRSCNMRPWSGSRQPATSTRPRRARPRRAGVRGSSRGEADVVLLAGDLTTSGEPEQAEVRRRRRAGTSTCPIFAVLGNHDYHAGRTDELGGGARAAAGIRLLDRECATLRDRRARARRRRRRRASSAASPARRCRTSASRCCARVYAETSAEADAIARGLQAIVHCDIRIVLLHYSPVADTLEGEPEGIHTYLGSERLATPIAEFGADLVLHGHAHAGSFQGCIGDDPGLQRRRPRDRAELLDLRARRQQRAAWRRGRGGARAAGIARLAAWRAGSSASASRP